MSFRKLQAAKRQALRPAAQQAFNKLRPLLLAQREAQL